MFQDQAQEKLIEAQIFSKKLSSKEVQKDKLENQLINSPINQLLDRTYGQYTKEIVKQFAQSAHQQGLNCDIKHLNIKFFKEDQFPGPQSIAFLKSNEKITVDSVPKDEQCLIQIKKPKNSIFEPKQLKITVAQNIKLQLQQQKQIQLNTAMIDKKRSQIINKNKLINQRLTNLQQILLTQSKNSKELKEHVRKGPKHKFTFDIDGQLLLFHQKNDNTNQQYNFGNRLITVGHKTTPCKFSSSEFSKQKRTRIKASKSKANEILFSKTVNILNANAKTVNILQTRNDSQKDAKNSKRIKVFSNNDRRQTTNIDFFNPQRGIKYSQLHTGNMFELTYNGSDMNQDRAFSARDKRIRDFHKFVSSEKKENTQRLARSITENKQLSIKLKTATIHPYLPKAFRAKTQQKEPSNRYFYKSDRISIKKKKIVQAMMQN